MRISLIGHSERIVRVSKALENRVFKVYHLKPASQELKYFCSSRKINLIPYSEKLIAEKDELVLLIECNRIIPKSQFSNGKWINLHSGILPYWRGLNANSWALLNRETKLGLSLHEVTEDVDAGRIIAQFVVENDQSSPYDKILESAFRRFENEISAILKNYISLGENFPYLKFALKEKKFIMCKKIPKKFGVITSYNIPNTEIFHRSRLFIRESGSDFFARIDGTLIKIGKVEIVHKELKGVEGDVLRREKERILIKTPGGGVWLSEYKAQMIH